MSKIKDKLLFAKLKSKDQQAFIEVYDQYIDKIYRFVYFKIGDSVEAEDLTSSIFLKTWNHIQQNSISDAKTLPALIYKIARNAVIDYYRKNSKEDSVRVDENADELDLPDEKQDLESKFELNSDLDLVNRKLALLKDEYREVIVLRYVEELSVSEISQVLEKSKGNVRILIFRALNALKELLKESEVMAKK